MGSRLGEMGVGIPGGSRGGVGEVAGEVEVEVEMSPRPTLTAAFGEGVGKMTIGRTPLGGVADAVWSA